MIASILSAIGLTNYAPLVPFLLIVIAIIAVMTAKMLGVKAPVIAAIAIILLLTATLFGFETVGANTFSFSVDNIARLSVKLLLPATVLITLMIFHQTERAHRKVEALLLVLISVLGAMVTIVSDNWMLFFIGIQCMSLPLYGLLVFNVNDQSALTSSIRYLMLSFTAMAILLFGILLLYASTGSLSIHQHLASTHSLLSTEGQVFGLGMVLIMVGIGFKASLFPFHFWAPEVYQGAQFSIIGYLIVIVKSIVVLFLLKISLLLTATTSFPLSHMIFFMAICSMWIGNCMMVVEVNFIRMMAFLSVAHLGALMLPILANNALGVEAVFLDLAAFGSAILVIFASLKAIFTTTKISINDLAGLFSRHKFLAMCITVALISIVGFPLTPGFVGKYAIFRAGVHAELWHLLAHFLLTSLFGLFVVARIIIVMWSPATIATQQTQTVAFPRILVCAAIAIVVIGAFPQWWIAWVKGYV